MTIRITSTTVTHALMPDKPIAFANEAEKADAINKLRGDAAMLIRQIGGNARVGSLTETEALLRARGADRRTIDTFKQFVPMQTPKPEAHRFDAAISRLESHQHQRLSRDINERLAGYYKDIKAREQAPTETKSALSDKGAKAVQQLEALRDRLLFDDTEDPTRLMRVEMTLRQFREGSEDAGHNMMADVLAAEKTLAAQRQQKLAERQAELRHQSEALDAYANGLSPIPEPEQQKTQEQPEPEQSLTIEVDSDE